MDRVQISSWNAAALPMAQIREVTIMHEALLTADLMRASVWHIGLNHMSTKHWAEYFDHAVI
jgi:hypothetical protein